MQMAGGIIRSRNHYRPRGQMHVTEFNDMLQRVTKTSVSNMLCRLGGPNGRPDQGRKGYTMFYLNIVC